jgi:hypothetical protein
VNTAVGKPIDLVLGGPVTPGNFLDQLSNMTPANPPPSLPLGSSQTAIYTRFCGVNGLINVPNSQNADTGTFVYVADTDNNLIRVLNSNTSLEIDSIPVPDPRSVSISANLETLFVANFGTNSVSVINLVNQAHTVVKEVTINPSDSNLRIGRGPKVAASQPDLEAVLVLNARDETIGIVSFSGGYEVRKVIDSNIGPEPYDIAVTWRQQPYAVGTGTYFAYITNRRADSISIFESGPTFPVIVGPDAVRIVLEDSQSYSFNAPTRMHTPLTGLGGTDVWYCNSGNGTVARLVLATFGAPPNPYFPNPAPPRTFSQPTVTTSFGPILDIAMGDNLTFCTPSAQIGILTNYKNNFGQISSPIKGYVSLGNQVAVFDGITGLDSGIRIPVPGVDTLMVYWKQ